MKTLKLFLLIAIFTLPVISQPITIRDLDNYFTRCHNETTSVLYTMKYMTGEGWTFYRAQEERYWYYKTPSIEGFRDWLNSQKAGDTLSKFRSLEISISSDMDYTILDYTILKDGTIVFYNKSVREKTHKPTKGKYKSEMPSIQQVREFIEAQKYDSVFVIQDFQLNTGHYLHSGMWIRYKKNKTLREIVEEIQGIKDCNDSDWTCRYKSKRQEKLDREWKRFYKRLKDNLEKYWKEPPSYRTRKSKP